MRTVSWSPSFRRAFRRYLRRHPEEQERILETLRRLVDNPLDTRLASHKLSGQLRGLWACSVGFDCRIVYELVRDPGDGDETVLLIDIGSHDDVY